MSQGIKYAVVSPVRNEAKYLQLTINSMVAQTIKPTHWVIVNDGSTDDTGKIAGAAVEAYPWIRLVNRTDRGFRKAGGGVIDAFYAGYAFVENESWEYMVKMDGDVSFESDYFEQCFESFRRDDKLGIAGGTICSNLRGFLEPESKVDPKFHVRGATKIYRSACWKQIGGLLRAPGWDTMDEVKSNMMGWATYTIAGLNVIHHRPTGAAYGAWKDRVKNGIGCYIMGYHPLFMFLKCVRRMAEKPYLIGGFGLLFGFSKGYVTGIPRIEDAALITYFRKQQMNRLAGRKSLWG